MMMKMLEAGGLPVLTDHIRAAGEDNPRGYYEYEAVKGTRDDASWPELARGRVVKIVHLLLFDLPMDRGYRVIFMRRELREVVASQRIMLTRLGTKGADLSDEQLIKAYEAHLEKTSKWLTEQSNVRVLYVNYNELMCNPAPIVETINRYLGGGLDTDAMLAVLDLSLYRQRAVT